jgi:proline dehydrogenase
MENAGIGLQYRVHALQWKNLENTLQLVRDASRRVMARGMFGTVFSEKKKRGPQVGFV